jgi:uncharacterized protein (DUF1501 family)
MASLRDAWDAEQLAIVHACGAPDDSRSHFTAMDLMERGVNGETGPASGWLGRYLASLDAGTSSPMRALGFGERLPRSLHGPMPATALTSLREAGLGVGQEATRLMQRTLASMYDGEGDLARVGRETLAVLDTLEKLDPAGYRPRAGAVYPESALGRALREIALLAKADVGLEVATLDLGGWDTHFAQGALAGQMPRLAQELAQGLAAFHVDLLDQLHRVTVVVMTEFGRRAYENASLGTDHGHGGMILLLGGAVAGGQVHGTWPGLEPDQLVGPGDLAITTDYRDVLAEILGQRVPVTALGAVFPDHSPRPRGVTRS